MPTSLQQIAASLQKVEANAQRVESFLKLVIANQKKIAKTGIPTADEIEASREKRAQYARDKKSGKNRNAKSPEQLERRREISRQSSAKHRMKKQMGFEARVEIDKKIRDDDQFLKKLTDFVLHDVVDQFKDHPSFKGGTGARKRWDHLYPSPIKFFFSKPVSELDGNLPPKPKCAEKLVLVNWYESGSARHSVACCPIHERIRLVTPDMVKLAERIGLAEDEWNIINILVYFGKDCCMRCTNGEKKCKCGSSLPFHCDRVPGSEVSNSQEEDTDSIAVVLGNGREQL